MLLCIWAKEEKWRIQGRTVQLPLRNTY